MTTTAGSKVPLTNKWYNRIKWTITVFLPAVGAFYFGLTQVWDFPRISGVNGTINLLITIGGVLIGYSTNQYNKTANQTDGDLIINEVDGEKFPALGVNHSSIDDLAAKDKITLNVVNNKPTSTTDTPPSA